jgi:hypothetical protein
MFPENYSLGRLKINGADRSARGRVVVPPGQTVAFSPSKDFLKDPSVVDKLNPFSFDRVNITAFSIDDEMPSFCDQLLPHFGHQKGISFLNVDRSDTTDVGLTCAAQLPNLEKLSAFETQADGRCLRQLCRLKRLRWVDFSCTNLKEEYFKYLPLLPQLQYLNLSRTQTTDAGVKTLAGCMGLLVLNLADNDKITDQCIDQLLQLKTLHHLALDGTAVTFKGAMRLTSLSLEGLLLPGNMTEVQCKQIKKAFLGVDVAFRTRKPEPVDSETRKLFAPLH